MAKRPVLPGETPRSGPLRQLGVIKAAIPPLHPKGLPFVGAPLVLAVLGRRHRPVRTAALAAAAASAAFFRAPKRVPPAGTTAVVAPADGEVTLVDEAVPPPELGLGPHPLPRVSIFLSVLDVHVQRAPVTGVVESSVHVPGQFLSADRPESSDRNERSSLRLRRPDGTRFGVVQIAGLIARRIVTEVQVGDSVTLGDTYGLIRFGSRVDTYLPIGTTLLVRSGQRTIGAETLLAEVPEATAAPSAVADAPATPPTTAGGEK